MTRMIPTALALALLAGAAQAHVVVQPATAEPGHVEHLRFVVGHGCSGQPTTALRVELPEEVAGAKPQPKPGWTLEVERSHGALRAVTWRGTLDAHQSDGFEIEARLPARMGRLAFAAAQSCGETTVRWDQPVPTDGSKPTRPAPSLMLEKAGAQTTAAIPRLPDGVQVLNGSLASSDGRPLYVWEYDTMKGMSHCFADCAEAWPPFLAKPGAKPFGDWSLISREDGQVQWTYRDKPLYTFAKDEPGKPPSGTTIPHWALAK